MGVLGAQDPQHLANQRAATPEGYRHHATTRGLAHRHHSLFSDDDALIAELEASAGLAAFEKHLPGPESPYQHLPEGGWVTGDAAVARGIDLRMYLNEQGGDDVAAYSLDGAVRLGSGACIGLGFPVSAHGGAVESILDEATAELAKCVFTPLLATVEANFRIKKAVPLDTTLRVECRWAARCLCGSGD